ncbi:MAG: VOC family protein [Deltaproteobacteria bacterium]|nr:VOC family protein [Deltaproteobacteria bacterium]
MEPRVNVITLGVSDLERARRFYQDALGFPMSTAGNEHIAFFRLGPIVLALFGRDALADDAGLAKTPPPAPGAFPGFTLAHNVRERDDVDRVLATVERAGAAILVAAHDAFWGGRSGYFADPDGNAWEVAWNPHFPLDAAGQVALTS